MTAVQVSQLLLHPVWYHWWSKDCSHCHRTGCLLMSSPYMASCKSILPAILLSGQVLLHSRMVSVVRNSSRECVWKTREFRRSRSKCCILMVSTPFLPVDGRSFWRWPHHSSGMSCMKIPSPQYPSLGFCINNSRQPMWWFLKGFFGEFTTRYIWGNDPILLTTMFQKGGTKTPPRNRIP